MAISLQGPVGLEASGHYLWGIDAGRQADHLYAFGPDLAIGTYMGGAGFWGQQMGLRQFLLYRSAVGVSTTAGVANYTGGWGLDDTRWYVQSGVTFAGIFSLEYAYSTPFTDARERVDKDRIVLRIELNSVVLNKLFERMPLS